VTDHQSLALYRLSDNSRRVLVQLEDRSQIAYPAVSPDGKSLAFSVLRPTVIRPDGSADFGADLYVAGIDGKNLRELVHHSSTGEVNQSASWLTNEDVLFEVRAQGKGGKADVRVEKWNVRTGVRTRLIDNAYGPAVSPDGKYVAIDRIDPATGFEEVAVYTSDFRGSKAIVTIRDHLGEFSSLVFSPASAKLAFAAEDRTLTETRPGVDDGSEVRLQALSLHPAAADVWLVNRDGSSLRRVAELADGRPSVAFGTAPGTAYVLGQVFWRISLTGGAPEQLNVSLSLGDLARLPQ
jgi:Tol biopolymer transport system component